jgi:hypothetical protein
MLTMMLTMMVATMPVTMLATMAVTKNEPAGTDKRLLRMIAAVFLIKNQLNL